MSTVLKFTKQNENLYNNLLKEVRKYRRRMNMDDPAIEKTIYIEELKHIKRLNLNFTSFTSVEIDNIPLISYFTGLEEIHLRGPYRPTGEELKQIPNKELIKEIEINNTDIKSVDLSNFPNLIYLTIVDNNELEEIKGLNSVNGLNDLIFYNNPLLNEKSVSKFIAANMKNECSMQIDILYYPQIRKLIRKEYSNYRNTFRATEWIEKVNVNGKIEDNIKHSTRAVGVFYSYLNEILNGILPKEEIDDLKTIYLIYDWIVENIYYDKEGIRNPIRLHTDEITVHFGDDNSKIKTSTSKGGTKGAFNALYNHETTSEGYANLFQMLLKLCLIDSYAVPAYCSPTVISNASKPTDEELKNTKPNHTLLKAILDDQPYYCDTTNELAYTANGDISQTCFMRTFEQLDSNWYPVRSEITKNVPPISESEREDLRWLRLADNKPSDKHASAERIMEKFDLHIDEKSPSIAIEVSVKKEQVEDLLLLDVINVEVEKIINANIEEEYYALLSEKKEVS